jgi:hypothetical protein
MTCPRCSADLPDSATFCQKCGASLRPMAEDELKGYPQGAPSQQASLRGPTFSYLPEGTPTWPTMIPQNTLYTTSASSPLAPTTGVIDRNPTASLTSQPIQKGRGENLPAAGREVKSKRSVRSTVMIVGVLLLSVLIGGGASLGILWANGQLFPNNATQTAVRVTVPTPTAASATPGVTPTPTEQGNQLPTPSSFQTLKITSLGISVKSPSDWQQVGPQATSSNDMEVALVPPQQIGIAVFIKRISASNSANLKSPADANQENLSEFANVSGVNNLQPSTTSQPVIAGVTWSEQDATFTSDQGDNYHYSTIAVQHNKLYYTISFYIPDVYHDEALQKYIQPMLNSFQFLS